MRKSVFAKKTYCVLPLKDMVMFPSVATAVLVAREKSVNAVEKAYENKDLILAVTQKDSNDLIITGDNVYDVGVLCKIIQKTSMPDGNIRIVIEGVTRASVDNFMDNGSYYFAEVTQFKQPRIRVDLKAVEDMRNIVTGKFSEYMDGITKIQMPMDVISSIKMTKTIDELVFYISLILPLSTDKRQELMAEKEDLTRLKKLFEYLEIEIDIIKTERKITEDIDKKMLRHQKKVYLNERLKSIKKELGEDLDENADDSDIGMLRKKIKEAKLSKEAREKCESELKKLEGMFSASPEYNVIRNYIDWIISLPWGVKSKNRANLKKAEEILDRDHYGLREVKERIMEFLAVYQKTKTLKGPIICFVGAPGVGKTSLARSIADALNRNYVKVSLGGVRDEAEIRGHRRTYVGAMPGKIIQSLKKAKTSNPLILLDEIDKMNSDFRGDPSSAMLEVLDPEQNKNFNDHYLEIDYDLSDVMFIATANNIANIPIPLRDRMEIIRLSGYTEDEKLNIAKKFLVPKQMKDHGVTEEEFSISDDAILKIIREYTFEAGVRNLEREIAKIIRKVAKRLITDRKIKSLKVTIAGIKDYLGVQKFNYNLAHKEDEVGVTTGLAYTDFGGDLLKIEALKFSGSGKLQTTGKLGEVMKESAQAAFSYVRSKADKFGVTAKEFNKYDFHLHVPEGATPKDGPSAGIAMTGALMSAMTGMKVRRDVAMTGEITLTGRVLPIGGLKEKLLAAQRGGIKTVIIPKENEKNLEDVPEKVLKSIKIKPVENLDDALKIMLVGYKK